MINVKKERTILFDIDVDKTVKIQVSIRRDGDSVAIFTKIGDEPAVVRETSIFNPNIVKIEK